MSCVWLLTLAFIVIGCSKYESQQKANVCPVVSLATKQYDSLGRFKRNCVSDAYSQFDQVLHGHVSLGLINSFTVIFAVCSAPSLSQSYQVLHCYILSLIRSFTMLFAV